MRSAPGPVRIREPSAPARALPGHQAAPPLDPKAINFRAEIEVRLTGPCTDLARRLPAQHGQARRQLVTELERFGAAEVVTARLPATCPYTFARVIGD